MVKLSRRKTEVVFPILVFAVEALLANPLFLIPCGAIFLGDIQFPLGEIRN
jgi:hypothetical protein